MFPWTFNQTEVLWSATIYTIIGQTFWGVLVTLSLCQFAEYQLVCSATIHPADVA